MLAELDLNHFSLLKLSHSLASSSGQIELLLTCMLILMTYVLRQTCFKKSVERYHAQPNHHFWRHLGARLIWPIVLIILLVIGAFLWHLTGHEILWFQFMVRAFLWMALIRTIMAIIRYTLPNGFFEASAEYFISGTLWVIFIVWLSGLDTIILNWLEHVKLPIGKSNISLLNIFSAIIWVGVILIFALWLARLLEARIMQLNRIDINVRIVINKLLSSVLIILAVLIALPMVGIDLTVLSVFGGALGVGLGFGLQKIASSYVSGFIILLERSLRLGDVVTISNYTGTVSKITSRYVVLKASDGSDCLIPNDTIISNNVINQSLSDDLAWTKVDVQVAYGTDLDKAMLLLVEAAKHNRIISNPAPTPYLISFGDSGINLSIGFWVADAKQGTLGLKSAILMNIWHIFKENDIEMPFPQREIRILNTPNNEHLITDSVQSDSNDKL
ncbi:mechanosensitive ion channel family protein [Neisseria sp. Ec49-e6-T10]|uniref:mechanosensitive ion channel family protein n=1 Tax=Neisseria sp. Ec49-e6-T10 TaxID=3140744 RepID=UPI003EB97A00